MVPPFGKLPIPLPFLSLEVYGKPMGALWERGIYHFFGAPGNSFDLIPPKEIHPLMVKKYGPLDVMYPLGSDLT